MFYVYLIKSTSHPDQAYIGYTTNLEERIKTHNSGSSPHTSKYRPWKIITYIAFDSEQKAMNFEKYIKIGSGHAFAKKRFW